MFLGANMDAVSEADSLGINASHAHTYTASAQGTSSVYDSVSATVGCIRSVDAKEYVDYITASCCSNYEDTPLSTSVKALASMIDANMSNIE